MRSQPEENKDFNFVPSEALHGVRLLTQSSAATGPSIRSSRIQGLGRDILLLSHAVLRCAVRVYFWMSMYTCQWFAGLFVPKHTEFWLTYQQAFSYISWMPSSHHLKYLLGLSVILEFAFILCLFLENWSVALLSSMKIRPQSPSRRKK